MGMRLKTWVASVLAQSNCRGDRCCGLRRLLLSFFRNRGGTTGIGGSDLLLVVHAEEIPCWRACAAVELQPEVGERLKSREARTRIRPSGTPPSA
jgi:hypothetical protein